MCVCVCVCARACTHTYSKFPILILPCMVGPIIYIPYMHFLRLTFHSIIALSPVLYCLWCPSLNCTAHCWYSVVSCAYCTTRDICGYVFYTFTVSICVQVCLAREQDRNVRPLPLSLSHTLGNIPMETWDMVWIFCSVRACVCARACVVHVYFAWIHCACVAKWSKDVSWKSRL